MIYRADLGELLISETLLSSSNILGSASSVYVPLGNIVNKCLKCLCPA